ncbi:MAG: ATP phosphoribosyltransferase [Proteobacteria bacterium]|nr:MAG: ATP phosphoribosyltransferase [Pseudomonadota bacterium]
MLTIALPKGRIGEDSLKIFEKIFNKKFVFEDRKLILEEKPFKFLLVRNQDVPVYVLHQAADLGIVGLDVLEEQNLDIVKLLDLGIGKCKVSIGVKNGDKLDYNKPDMVIASKMENITRNYFLNKAIAVKVIKLYGSIELAPLVNLCDAIVDIVETGATMKQNGLSVVEDIMSSSAHLIANKNSFIEKKEDILCLYQSISKVI